MKRSKKNHGFTTVELLVAIALSFILISVIYSAYHFSFRYPKIWNTKITLENTALLCMKRFSRDLLSAKQISTREMEEIILTMETGPPVTYHIENDRLFRNDILLNEDNVRLLNFHLKPAETQDDQSLSMELNTGPLETDPHELWELEMTFANNRSQFTLYTSVSPRRINPMDKVQTQLKGELL